MELREFKKYIYKKRWLEKYYFYLIACGAIGGGIFLLYKSFFDTAKIPDKLSHLLMFSSSAFLIGLGSLALSLIANRYKILVFECNGSIEVKKKVIAKTMNEFNALFSDNLKCLWQFHYQRNWWGYSYDVYFTIDQDSIFACVVGETGGRGGFIDLGQTEKFRKKISKIIDENIDMESLTINSFNS